MAEIDEGIYARLSGYGGLTALVSTRIFPQRLPQDVTTLPAVVFQAIVGERVHAMSGDPGLMSMRFQVTVFAETALGAAQAMTQVRGALQDYAGTVGGVTILHSELDGEGTDYSEAGGVGEGVFQRWQDFVVWHAE